MFFWSVYFIFIFVVCVCVCVCVCARARARARARAFFLLLLLCLVVILFSGCMILQQKRGQRSELFHCRMNKQTKGKTCQKSVRVTPATSATSLCYRLLFPSLFQTPGAAIRLAMKQRLIPDVAQEHLALSVEKLEVLKLLCFPDRVQGMFRR